MNKRKYETKTKEPGFEETIRGILKLSGMKKPELVASTISIFHSSEIEKFQYKEENKILKAKKSPFELGIEGLAMVVGALLGAFITTLNLIYLVMFIFLFGIRGVLGFKYGK